MKLFKGDYQKGIIYRWINDVNSTVYYGSTIDARSRKAMHKHDAKKSEKPLYQAMRTIGFDRFKFEVVEQYPCNNRKELEAREYSLLSEALAAGTPVYNQKLSAREKRSEATKLAISKAKTGVATKHGHLKLTNGSYVFVWRDQKNIMTRSFSCAKYGALKAKQMAWDVRQSIYPEWKPDPEEEFCTWLLLLQLDLE